MFRGITTVCRRRVLISNIYLWCTIINIIEEMLSLSMLSYSYKISTLSLAAYHHIHYTACKKKDAYKCRQNMCVCTVWLTKPKCVLKTTEVTTSRSHRFSTHTILTTFQTLLFPLIGQFEHRFPTSARPECTLIHSFARSVSEIPYRQKA